MLTMAKYIEKEKVLSMSYCVNKPTWDNPHLEPKSVVDVIDIEALPTADVVEVVHGHWKGIELKDTCSVCNRSISEICDADSYIEIEVLSELIACPFCGAKMDGVKNG